MSYEVYEALMDGDIDTLEQLIKQGEDIFETTQYDKWTYLHRSLKTLIELTPETSIQYLIDQGLDVNAIDNFGYTPIIYATRQCNLAGVRLLLKYGAAAKINHRSHDHCDVLSMILECDSNQYLLTKELLSHGADPDVVFSGNRSFRESIEAHPSIEKRLKDLVKNHPQTTYLDR